MGSRFSKIELNEEGRESKTSLEASSSRFDDRHYLDKAAEDFRWGRFESALRYYTRALQENRALVPAWVGQVQMLVQLGEYREASMWSEKALELFKNNGELLAARAQALARLKDRKSALASSDGALGVPGTSPWRWQARGEVLLAAGQRHYDECFQKAISEPAADWFDRVIVAGIYLFYQRATNALGYLQLALDVQPAHGYLWFMRGQAQTALGLVTSAQQSYERCMELRPDYREARDALESLPKPSWLRTMFRGFSR